MKPVPIESRTGRQPSPTALQLADAVRHQSFLELVSLKIGDHPEIETLEACFEAGGGTLFYTFDCSRSLTENIAEFQEYAANQLALHGEPPPAARAAGGASNGD